MCQHIKSGSLQGSLTTWKMHRQLSRSRTRTARLLQTLTGYFPTCKWTNREKLQGHTSIVIYFICVVDSLGCTCRSCCVSNVVPHALHLNGAVVVDDMQSLSGHLI